MNPPDALDLRASIRTITDYPKPGIKFRDITTLLGNARAFRRAVDDLVNPWAGSKIDKVAGIEARGFILGAATAYAMGVGFVPVRKAGKLPGETYEATYTLEYGTATLEIHVDAFVEGQRVLIMDDVLATGGTAAATCELVERAGGEVVAVDVVLEIGGINGRDALVGREVVSLLVD